MELLEVGRRGVRAVLVEALVPGGAHVPCLVAAELPDDPVRGLDPAAGRLVDLAILLEYLKGFRELPLGGDAAAVAREPRLAARRRHRRDALGLRLGRVVLPELRVGVGAIDEL